MNVPKTCFKIKKVLIKKKVPLMICHSNSKVLGTTNQSFSIDSIACGYVVHVDVLVLSGYEHATYSSWSTN
jgi:hypothetical protein